MLRGVCASGSRLVREDDDDAGPVCVSDRSAVEVSTLAGSARCKSGRMLKFALRTGVFPAVSLLFGVGCSNAAEEPPPFAVEAEVTP